jgi:HSP20 family molecular chaperone IbpA
MVRRMGTNENDRIFEAGPLAGKGASMKNPRSCFDLGSIFDEIFDATENFRDEFHRNFKGFDNFRGDDPENPFMKFCFDENTDYYPNYSYPPMNAYMSADRSLTFEFALAGFDEKNISLAFQGDYMIFSAKIGDADPQDEQIRADVHYFKRRLKLKDIEKQKYYVPLDKYAQEKVKAVFKNGILRVTVPPKDEVEQNDGIKIEIIKEGN